MKTIQQLKEEQKRADEAAKAAKLKRGLAFQKINLAERPVPQGKFQDAIDQLKSTGKFPLKAPQFIEGQLVTFDEGDGYSVEQGQQYLDAVVAREKLIADPENQAQLLKGTAGFAKAKGTTLKSCEFSAGVTKGKPSKLKVVMTNDKLTKTTINNLTL